MERTDFAPGNAGKSCFIEGQAVTDHIYYVTLGGNRILVARSNSNVVVGGFSDRGAAFGRGGPGKVRFVAVVAGIFCV